MKKILIASLAGFLSVLVATNKASAQNSANTEALEIQKVNPSAEKSASNDQQAAIRSINQKALKSFSKTYKNVTGESWEKTSEGFAAKFIADGVRSLVYYGHGGNWLGSLKGYSEDKLSPALRKIVKSVYYDFSITYVQEAETVDSEGKPTYIVHLEDKNNIVQVRIFDGQMEVWREYKKQS